MGIFDSSPDRPDQIKVEGQEIILKFDKTGTTTGKIYWNIPPPASGCTSETQAYCGILVTLNTEPASIENAPVDNTIYVPDPTGDYDLHSGDKIGNALVVGAFYEQENKGNKKPLTTSFEISGLKPNTAYYISGYAVDCTIRYHREGTFAYSQTLGGKSKPDTSGYQTIILKESANLTDGTGLESGTLYSFTVFVDDKKIELSIDGSNAQTYQDLINQINSEFNKNSDAIKSAIAPNTGIYWYNKDERKLYQYNGTTNIEIEVINESTDPTAIAIGEYWYDTLNNILYTWNGSNWVTVQNIVYYHKNTTKGNLNSSDYWLKPGTESPQVLTKGYQRCGNAWCELVLYNQTEDPSVNNLTFNCNTFWFNSETNDLSHWNEETCRWENADVIYWNEDPTQLTTGTYWFNDNEKRLYQYGTPLNNKWNLVGYGYQDIVLSGANGPYTLDQNAIVPLGSPPPGSPSGYQDTISISGNTINLELNICNDIDSTFEKVFKEINRQLNNQGTIQFINDNTIRIVSSTPSPPQIQPGGNLFNSIIDFVSIQTPSSGINVKIQENTPTNASNGHVWIKESTQEIFLYDSRWKSTCGIFFSKDPTDIQSCNTWWNSDEDIIYKWDSENNIWTPVDEFFQQNTDPTLPPVLSENSLWYDLEKLYKWDGTQWEEVTFISYTFDPTQLNDGDIWYNTEEKKWYIWSWFEEEFTEFDPVDSKVSPLQNDIPSGSFWYDTTNDLLYMWNGTNWINIVFTLENPVPDSGFSWYNTTNGILYTWNGTTWEETQAVASSSLDINGHLVITSKSTGSTSKIQTDISNSTLLKGLTLFSYVDNPICGSDGLSSLPSHMREGIGTDGSTDEIRNLSHDIRVQLGYPVIQVELTKEQINKAITVAIEELRRHSSAGYRRGFMKLNIKPGIQRYILTNKASGVPPPNLSEVGYDSITDIMGIHRVTSAFLTSAHGSGIFGQVVLQHLYNMGTFDLLSYHLISQYIEQLEILFASRLVYHWNETDRSLWIHQSFTIPEIALMDVAVERTSQDLLLDRYTKRWIEKYALAYCRMMLSEIRGKFSTLPGAGGSITLNASDLALKANEEMERLVAEIDNYIVNNLEEFGAGTDIIIG